MMKVINTVNAPAAIGPYSQAIEAGGVVYVSGQLPLDPTTMEFAPGGVAAQTKQCLENIKAIVEEAGLKLENIAKCGIFLKSLEDFAAVNEVYAQYFTDHKPARFCVEVARLPKDALIEIDAIAVK